MTDDAPPARRAEGGYLFVRKGARRVSIDDALPGRGQSLPSVEALLESPAGPGGIRYVRPTLDPAAVDPRLCFFTSPSAPVCDLYRASAAELRGHADGVVRILVTSPRGRSGRTTTVINLGSALAEHDRVVLVDLHRRRPGLARAFGLTDQEGLLAALSRQRRTPGSPIDVTLLAERLAALFVEADAPAEALSLSAVRTVLDVLSTAADRVLVDGPPVLDGDAVLELAALADGILIVLEPGDMATGDYERTLERLEGRRIVGTLINDRGPGRR